MRRCRNECSGKECSAVRPIMPHGEGDYRAPIDMFRQLSFKPFQKAMRFDQDDLTLKGSHFVRLLPISLMGTQRPRSGTLDR